MAPYQRSIRDAIDRDEYVEDSPAAIDAVVDGVVNDVEWVVSPPHRITKLTIFAVGNPVCDGCEMCCDARESASVQPPAAIEPSGGPKIVDPEDAELSGTVAGLCFLGILAIAAFVILRHLLT